MPEPAGDEAELSGAQGRPAGLTEQLNLAEGGGGSPCSNEGGFTVRPADEAYRTLEPPAIGSYCVVGASSGSPVTVTVTDPVGEEIKRRRLPPVQTDYPLPPYFQFRVLPWDPVGTYKITARQGGRTAVARVDVRRRSTPHIRFIADSADGEPTWSPERQPRPGDTLTFALGGFSAGATARVHLYRAAPGFGREPDGSFYAGYHASFPVRVGGHGGARFVLRITGATPPGCYGATAEPAPTTKAQALLFCVGDA